ncbi:MAG: competence protein ComEC [Candidatus Sumerlaeota bacterium]|nr:competence protein ComEC [Candidatus Sumerlaeota bacterium]
MADSAASIVPQAAEGYQPEREFPRPSLVAVLALMGGLVAGRELGMDRLAPGAALVVAAFVLGGWMRHRPRGRAAALALAFGGFGLLLIAPHVAAREQAGRLLGVLDAAPSGPVVLAGRVASDPRPTGSGRLRVQIAPGAVLQRGGAAIVFPLSVMAWLPEHTPMPALAVGDVVEATGAMDPLSPNPLPGEPDSLAVQRGAGATFRARAWSAAPPVRGRSPMARVRLSLRQMGDAIQAIILDNLGARTGPLLVAGTLGRTHLLLPGQRTAFQRAGLAHIFAVSGLHAGLVGILLALAASALGLGARWRAVLVLAGVLSFCGITGLRISALRAACIVAVFLAQPFSRREIDPLGGLASVALVFLLLRPLSLWQVDFQLSFLAATTMVFALPGAVAIEENLGRTMKGSWGFGWLIRGLQVFFLSACIQVALAPVLSAHLRSVSLAAPLANTLVLPLLPLLMGAAFAATALAWLVPWLGELAFGILDPALGVVDAAARLLGGWEWSAASVGGAWPGWITGAWYALLLGGRWALLRPRFTPLDGWLSGAAGVGAAVAVALLGLSVRPPDDVLRVTFFDVDQGDAVLIEARGGARVLVDAGPERGQALVRDLALRGIDRLDALVLTHADADHIGGAPAVIEALRPGRVIVGGSLANTEAWVELAEAVAWRDLRVATVRRGARLALAPGVRADVLHPTDESLAGGTERNDASVVLRVVAGEVAFLLTGDAAEGSESDMVRAFGSEGLACSVLKAGHHGSNSSSSGVFLDAAAPRIAVISCGRENRYGHPSPAVLQRLAARGIDVARTDREGTIAFETDGVELRITRERPAFAAP